MIPEQIITFILTFVGLTASGRTAGTAAIVIGAHQFRDTDLWRNGSTDTGPNLLGADATFWGRRQPFSFEAGSRLILSEGMKRYKGSDIVATDVSAGIRGAFRPGGGAWTAYVGAGLCLLDVSASLGERRQNQTATGAYIRVGFLRATARRATLGLDLRASSAGGIHFQEGPTYKDPAVSIHGDGSVVQAALTVGFRPRATP